MADFLVRSALHAKTAINIFDVWTWPQEDAMPPSVEATPPELVAVMTRA